MDLRQIQYFVALYEERSITKTARRLHVVQPAVSMQIRRIEVEYGVTLFERTPAGVIPNDAAQSIYPACRDILAKVEQVRHLLRDRSGTLSGSLAVGVPPSIAHGLLADVLLDFRSRHPAVQLSVYEGYSVHLVDWLLQGDLDFAILSEFDDDRRFRCQPLATEALRVVTSAETAVPGDRMTGKDLVRLKLIVPSAKNLIRLLIDSEFERQGLSLEPAMEVDSLSTVFAAVRQAGWASILPASAFRESDLASGLRSLELTEPAIRRTLVAAFPALKPVSAAAQEFMTSLKAAMADKAAATVT